VNGVNPEQALFVAEIARRHNSTGYE